MQNRWEITEFISVKTINGLVLSNRAMKAQSSSLIGENDEASKRFPTKSDNGSLTIWKNN